MGNHIRPFPRRPVSAGVAILLLGGGIGAPARAAEDLPPSGEKGPAARVAPFDAPEIPPRPAERARRSARGFGERSLATLRWPFRPVEDFTEAVFDGLSRLFPSETHLPRHLQGRRHWDYPWPFHAMPRAWTTYDWGPPEMLLGNQERHENGSPKPIGEPGSFQLSRYPRLPLPLSWMPLYLAFTTPGGVHVRLGARWDDVDAYTQFPSIALKRLHKKRESRPAPPRGPDEPEPSPQ